MTIVLATDTGWLIRRTAGHYQQNDRIGEGGEDRAAAQPVGEPIAGPATAQNRRTPGQRETEHVPEVVPGIGNQSKRTGEDPGNRFASNIDKVEGDPNREGAPVIQVARRMTMFGRARGVIVLHGIDHI